MISPVHQRFSDVSAVILAGGRSSRMGSNKALLPYRGGRFIEAIHRQLAEMFAEVILVTNNPEQYDFLPCRTVPDRYTGCGVLAGIHSGLYHSLSPAIFAVACDMPYLSEHLIRHLTNQADERGVVIPESPVGIEPLHAVYGRGCLPAVETVLMAGEMKIRSFFDRVPVTRVSADEVETFDPGFNSFRNINTPDEYFQLRMREREGAVRESADPGDEAYAGVRRSGVSL